jgi:hypothetical protein
MMRMADESSYKNFTERFKTFQFWIVAILGLVSTVIGFIRLIQGNSKLATVVLLVVGITLSYAILIFVRRAKVPTSQAIILVGDDQKAAQGFKYSRKVRRGALLAGVAVTVVLLASSATFIYYQYRAPRTMLILVADFDGPEPKN